MEKTMVEAMEATPSISLNFDLHVVRSRTNELEELERRLEDDEASSSDSLGSEKLLKDCALYLESKLLHIVSEGVDAANRLAVEDLDAYTEHLKEELSKVEAESSEISNEIEDLNRTYIEDSIRLKTDLEVLKCSLNHFTSQSRGRAISRDGNGCSVSGGDPMNDENGCNGFEVLELDSQIEKNKRILKSFQELDGMVKSLDVIEQIEDTFGGLKVIEVFENFIRLSLRTHLPDLEELSILQKVGVSGSSELNHELLIEILEGTKELKNVEIFPADVHLRDLIDASKSFSNSSLEWFVRKVQDRIIMCTLRRLVVKNANTSRHSFQYMDQDETIVYNMIGGIYALIKVSQGWPLSNSPLKLISLKNSDHHFKGISLSLICKVEKMANSLDVHLRQNLSSFADAVEKTLKEQMHLELQTDSSL